MSVRIRPLAVNDKDRWTVMWKGYRDFYESPVSDEVTEGLWQRLMTRDKDPRCFVAVDENDTVVGIVQYWFQQTCWDLRERIYLQDLFVDPACRGQGAGRKLIEAVYNVAEASNCCEVYWTTQDFNVTARKLYDQVATLTPFVKYTKRFP